MFTPSQPCTGVFHKAKHFQYVLMVGVGWGAEGVWGGSEASFWPLKNTHLSPGLCTYASFALCSSSFFCPQYHDFVNLLWVKHQQSSLLVELLQRNAVLEFSVRVSPVVFGFFSEWDDLQSSLLILFSWLPFDVDMCSHINKWYREKLALERPQFWWPDVFQVVNKICQKGSEMCGRKKIRTFTCFCTSFCNFAGLLHGS